MWTPEMGTTLQVQSLRQQIREESLGTVEMVGVITLDQYANAGFMPARADLPQEELLVLFEALAGLVNGIIHQLKKDVLQNNIQGNGDGNV